MKLNTWAQSISEKLFSLSFLRKRFPSLSDVESFLLSKVSWHLMSHVRSSSAEGRQRLRKTLVNNAEQKFPSSCSPTRSVHQIHILQIFFVSSDRSSCTDDGPQYIRGATFSDFEHLCLSILLQVSL